MKKIKGKEKVSIKETKIKNLNKTSIIKSFDGINKDTNNNIIFISKS